MRGFDLIALYYDVCVCVMLLRDVCVSVRRELEKRQHIKREYTHVQEEEIIE